MAQRVYTIRRAFLYPLGIDSMLLLCLFVLALLRGSTTERFVFGLFFIPALYVFLECIFRRITVDEEGIAIRKLWREKRLFWREINHIGGLNLHKKIYLLISTTKGFFIVSNAFGEFFSLKEEIVSRVEPAKVEEDVRTQAAYNASGIAHIAMAWVAAVFMIGIILMKIGLV